MAMSKLELRMLDGILRPAIAATFPHKKGEFVMLDLGQILNVVKRTYYNLQLWVQNMQKWF